MEVIMVHLLEEACRLGSAEGHPRHPWHAEDLYGTLAWGKVPGTQQVCGGLGCTVILVHRCHPCYDVVVVGHKRCVVEEEVAVR